MRRRVSSGPRRSVPTAAIVAVVVSRPAVPVWKHLWLWRRRRRRQLGWDRPDVAASPPQTLNQKSHLEEEEKKNSISSALAASGDIFFFFLFSPAGIQAWLSP